MTLGIELGSTRIKAILIDGNANELAAGGCEWDNNYTDGYWTYSEQDIWHSLRACFANLSQNYRTKYGIRLTKIDAIGISAMMHGYIALDKEGELLVPFRTWRNTNTGMAAAELTQLFDFNIPMRWSVAHFYDAVRNKEPHISDIDYLTTLAGYVHYKLTGEKVLGIGDASGMFPCDGEGFRKDLLSKFDDLLVSKGVDLPFETILPKVLLAGENAGMLTSDGARLLDPTGLLQPGAVFCPPEGDAATGMVATNSIAPCTANVSAGTSAFLMAVLNKPLEHLHREIDIVSTPCGEPVAMVHANNFTNELNAWCDLFSEVAQLTGGSSDGLMLKLFEESLQSDRDVGGLMGYNFLSGEPIVGLERGAPIVIRGAEGKFNLANFMQMQIYSALGTLAIGTQILYDEGIVIDEVCGHGGFFKTAHVGQWAMSAALNAPVTVMKNAGEGGAWGMALLALYRSKTQSLESFLQSIFAKAEKATLMASQCERDKFSRFLDRYKNGLAVAKAAAEGDIC